MSRATDVRREALRLVAEHGKATTEDVRRVYDSTAVHTPTAVARALRQLVDCGVLEATREPRAPGGAANVYRPGPAWAERLEVMS